MIRVGQVQERIIIMLIFLKYEKEIGRWKGHLNIGREEGFLYATTFQCVIVVNEMCVCV